MSEILLTQEQLEKLVAGIAQGATVAQACGISTETLESLYALAYGTYSSGNYSDALVVFQALTLYDPNDVRFWMGLGGARQALSQYESAIEAYQMAAVASLLKNPEPMLHAAFCLIKLGRKEDAKVALESVLAIGENDPQYEKARERARALSSLLDGE